MQQAGPFGGLTTAESVLLIAAVVLFVLYYRRTSRNHVNLRISRDRANLDLQMISHQIQIRVETQSEDSASLPDSLPAKRPMSLAKAPTASLPPGPPSSSAGQSVAEREVTRPGVAGSGVAPTVPALLAAPTVWPYPSLHHASSSAARKRPAQPLWAGLADWWQGKAKRATSSSASATSSCSSDDSGPEPGNTATHALPPTRAAPFAAPPTTAPTAQLAASPPLPPDLAQMFDEPIGLSAAPTAPLAASAAPTVSSSSWLLDEIGVSDTPYVYTLLTYPHVRTGLLTYSPAYSIEVAVEEAMLEVDTSEAIEEVIGETIVESNAIVEAIEEAIEEVIEKTIVESNAAHA